MLNKLAGMVGMAGSEGGADKQPFDQVNWLKLLVEQAWPELNEAISKTATESVDATLKQYKPGAIKELYVKRLDLGDHPPLITEIRTREARAEDEIVLDLKLEWLKGAPNFFLAMDPHYFPEVTVKLKDIDLRLWARVTLKPLTGEALPCFGALLVALEEEPHVGFELEFLQGASNLVPGLKSMIDGIVKNALVDMLMWPNRFVVPILATYDYRPLLFVPSGVVVVTLLEAVDLADTDRLSKPDPVATFYVRKKSDRIVKSSCKANTYTPVWNETLEVPCEDPAIQSLTVEVADEEGIGKGNMIGSALVPLKGITEGEAKDVWVDLKLNDEARGRLHFSMTWRKYKEGEGPLAKIPWPPAPAPPPPAPVEKPFQELKLEDAESVMPLQDTNPAVANQPFEELRWLNAVLEQAWPHVNQAVSATARTSVDAALKQYKPGALKGLSVERLDLGNRPPLITGIRTREAKAPNEIVLDVKLEWLQGCPQFYLNINPYVFPDVTIKVKDIDVRMWLRLTLKPLTAAALPCFGAVLIALQEEPHIGFDIEFLQGTSDLIPGLKGLIDSLVKNAVSDMLAWPNRMVVPIIPTFDYRPLLFLPSGVVEVTLFEAADLADTDRFSKPDPVVLLFVRKLDDRIVKSSGKSNTHHPKWNETLEVLCEDPDIQNLTVQVRDEETIGKDKEIGMAVVPLAGLKAAPKDLWVDLKEENAFASPGAAQDAPLRGRLHLRLAWRKFNPGEGPASKIPWPPVPASKA